MSVELTIDGKRVTGKKGQTILEVAQENRIHIPTLCLYPGAFILGRLTALCSGFLDKLSGTLTVSWNHFIPCSVKKMLAQPSGEVILSTGHSR